MTNNNIKIYIQPKLNGFTLYPSRYNIKGVYKNPQIFISYGSIVENQIEPHPKFLFKTEQNPPDHTLYTPVYCKINKIKQFKG